MLSVARAVAAKDLRIEWRSRTIIGQVVPFAAIMLVMFAFALDNGGVVLGPRGIRSTVPTWVAPGLLWLATLLSALIVVQRSYSVETADGALDALRVAGVDLGGVFLGKAAALAVQLLALEAIILVGDIVLFDTRIDPDGVVLLVTAALAATVGLAAIGTLYGGLTAGAKGRETLLPLLLLPVAAPVLIGATRACDAAFGTGAAAIGDGWPWVGMLALFAVAFSVAGVVAFGPLIDE